MGRPTVRMNKSFITVVTMAFLWTTIGAAQTDVRTVVGGTRSTPIRKVFLNLTGDPRLAHHLWLFLELKLDDVHIALANTEKDADAIVDGVVTEETTTQNLSHGLIKITTKTNGKTDKLDLCASTSTTDTGDLFVGSSANVLTRLRGKYPKAVTVKIDPESNTSLSDGFVDELRRSLKTSDFKIAESGTADIELEIDLAKEKIPIAERTVRYDVKVLSREGVLSKSEGTGILSAGLEGSAPPACPASFDNFDWLLGNDALFQTARSIAKQLQTANSRATLSTAPSGK